MIYMTGDTHGDYNDLACRIRSSTAGEGDHVIITGDFGFVWREGAYSDHAGDLDRLERFSCTILFADGNHEDYDLLEKYPEEDWHGGRVHRIRSNILHLMRGYVFDIGGSSFFVFGGAYSVDKGWRTPGESWWSRELPSAEEYRRASENLEKCGYKVDYVVTHTIPKLTVYSLGITPDEHDAELTGYFEWLFGHLEFRLWYAGHFHLNGLFRDRLRILYQLIEPIDSVLEETVNYDDISENDE
ncbi:MAG: metallophosphoesterase [Ruminococcus sp.]|nr:metallophosphoesterase [Ruminococcus sp.]